MFGEFLNIVFKSIKLDKSLYTDNKNFGEASVYFAGLIMILDGIAGAVAANTVIKTAVAMSGLVLTAVGFAHAPGLLRFFAVTPNMMIPIIFLTQFWIFAGLIISTKHVLGLRSSIKSFGIVFLSFLIIAFLSISFVMSRMNMLPVNQIS